MWEKAGLKYVFNWGAYGAKLALGWPGGQN